MASTYELIETTTLTSSASSVTFTSITQDYRDLVLVVEHGTSSTTATAYLRFNSDSGSNYSNVVAYGNGSSALSTSGTETYINTRSLAASGQVSLSVNQIMDYSATDKHKTTLTRSNRDTEVYMVANRWANTSAITAIEIFSAGASLNSGSSFSLYGIAS